LLRVRVIIYITAAGLIIANLSWCNAFDSVA